jgi:tetratricopeptide (TPR) repeat protein
LIGGTTGTTLALLQAERNAKQVRDERDAKDGALKAEQQARAGETKARQQAFAALRSMTDNVVERKFAQGTDLTDEDRAFLRGVIAQYDAFAAINGDDVDSQALRAEGRWRIGLMRTRLGEVQEAEKAYDEAVSISERLAAELPTRIEFRMWLAFSLQNRSELLFARGRPQEGEKDFDQAFSISKQLAADFPQNPGFRKLLAKSHRFRGDLLVATRRLNEAEKEYDLAVSIQERLAADFPKDPVFRLDLAKSHTARANLLKYTGRLKEAEKEHDMAVSIQERLAADFPKQPELRKDLAEILNDRGTFLMQTGRLKEAEKDFDQALSICGQLVADFPLRPRFQYLLATGHLNRGGLLSQTPSRLREAEQDLDQAISITKQCGANSPSSRGSGTLAAGYTNRGIVLEQTGRLKEAEKDLDQALSMRRQLAAGTPNQPDLQNDVAGSCVNLANFYSQQRNWAAAQRLLLEGRAHHLVALKANPRHPTYRQFYRNHLNTLAQVHAELLEREEAVRTAETRRELGWNPPADAYDAAGFLIRCIPIVAQHDKLDDKQRQEAVRFYGDAAMKLLREAVSNGYKDVVHMKKDPALAPLRQRQDFLKLVAALEGKGK